MSTNYAGHPGDICLSHSSYNCSTAGNTLRASESQNYKETNKKKKGNSKFCNLGFLDELQLCELPEVNQKMPACICIFLGKRPWLSSDSQDSWWLTKPLERPGVSALFKQNHIFQPR